MKLRKWLEKHGMTSIEIKPPFFEAEWRPQNEDQGGRVGFVPPR
uniref:Uncharacterized protein n=1 Tax=Candidatus Kentrum sp. FW TaxID=2126338 RepID=A0A450TN73_9GAMM|nr:MAG: hypothetical protein BECKFW1821C_GA0114237_101813 [Candidatus Kentron sp. FW]